MLSFGVDPGSRNGAIASWDGKTLAVFDLPTQERSVAGRLQHEIDGYALADLIRGMMAQHTVLPQDCYAVIEKVGPWGTDSKIAAANFVGAAREIRGVIKALGIPCQEMTVPAWRKIVGVGKCEAKDKGPVVVRANELFPSYIREWKLKKNINRAEASLIALAGWIQWRTMCDKGELETAFYTAPTAVTCLENSPKKA